MSAKSLAKSHATAWMLALLAIPLLYVLSVPVVFRLSEQERAIAGVIPTSHGGHNPVLTDSTIWMGRVPDAWVLAFSAPYRWLCAHTPLQQPLLRYEYFWQAVGRP